MKTARYAFGVAAIYGLLTIIPLFFNEQKLGIEYPPLITHAEYFYSFAAVTLVWQIVFICIALNPLKYRPVMPFCVMEKLCLVPTFIILFPQGRFPALWIPLLMIDIVFGAGFLVAFIKTKNNSI
jgi:hypothetical protein